MADEVGLCLPEGFGRRRFDYDVRKDVRRGSRRQDGAQPMSRIPGLVGQESSPEARLERHDPGAYGALNESSLEGYLVKDQVHGFLLVAVPIYKMLACQ